jgi:DNA-binding transcriptional regulator YiaG
MLWRAPGRRDEERKRFAASMRKVEAIRVRGDLTKQALAAEIGTNEDGLHSWLSGRSVGRAETAAKIKQSSRRENLKALLL